MVWRVNPMSNYKFGDYDLSLDPELQKLIEQKIALEMPEYSLPQSEVGLPVPELKTSDLGFTPAPDTQGQMLEKLRTNLSDRLQREDADNALYQAELAKSKESAGPAGWQKGLGIFAAGLQGMATQGKDLSLATSLNKGWDENVKKAGANLVDPSKVNKDMLDKYIKMKSLDTGDQEFGQRKELKQMDLDAADKRLQEQRSFDMKLAGAKPSEFAKEVEKKDAEQFAKTQEQLPKIGQNLEKVRNAISSQREYSSSTLGGTGPIATGFGAKKYFSQDTESLDAQFKDINLNKMVSMFGGMSKAVDSDAERKAFESTTASIKNDDKTNLKILYGTESALLKEKAIAEAKSDYVSRMGNLKDFDKSNPVLQGKMTTVVDSTTGEMELVPKNLVPALKKEGKISVDEYVDMLSENKYQSKAVTTKQSKGAPWMKFGGK